MVQDLRTGDPVRVLQDFGGQMAKEKETEKSIRHCYQTESEGASIPKLMSTLIIALLHNVTC